jgi:hypothetical protein
MAHILRLANDIGIDLEQAYLEKVRLNLGRNKTTVREPAETGLHEG